MRALTLLPLLYLPAVLAAPGQDHDAQVVFGKSAALADAADGNETQHVVGPVVYDGGNALLEDEVETWSEDGKELIRQNGIVCTSFSQLWKWRPAQPVTFQ